MTRLASELWRHDHPSELVLTAAHCVVRPGNQLRPASSVSIVEGTNDLRRGGRRIRGSDPPASELQHGSPGLRHDIALLRLAEAGPR